MQTDYIRYAVYFVPRSGSELARFGREWLGMDAEDGKLEDAPSSFVIEPRRYGFHATLKAPMRLAPGVKDQQLFSAVERLAKTIAPTELGILKPERIGSFLALVCDPANHGNVASIAWQCVTMLDRFRATLSEQEQSKRPNLSIRQTRNLHLWGYPYIAEDFRFHMTLTSQLSKEKLEEAAEAVDPLLPKKKITLDSICVLGDPGGTKPFELLERFDLQG